MAFDVFVVERSGAESDYSASELAAGRARFEQLQESLPLPFAALEVMFVGDRLGDLYLLPAIAFNTMDN